MQLANFRIQSKNITRLNVVHNELKNKSVVFIFFEGVMQPGAAVIIICIGVCISIMHGMAAIKIGVSCYQGGGPLLCRFLLFDDAKVYIHIDKTK